MLKTCLFQIVSCHEFDLFGMVFINVNGFELMIWGNEAFITCNTHLDQNLVPLQNLRLMSYNILLMPLGTQP